MYHYVEDELFLNNMKSLCSNIVNQLKQSINNDGLMRVDFSLVGSGKRHLITQNANEPIDLDFNLIIKDISFNINEADRIKNYVIKMFNKVLSSRGWSDCDDSTAVLSTEFRHFTKGNPTEFKIDLAITTYNSDGTWYRLIHKKTGIVTNDSWIWNEGPHSKGIEDKAKRIRMAGKWFVVENTYLDKKNMYLTRGDHNHPSFNCYIETVNEVNSKLSSGRI